MSHPLFTDVLDAGDRLAAALDASDLVAAERAVEERDRAIDALARAGLAAPPEALAHRAEAQAERIRQSLDAASATLQAAISAAARRGAAQDRYAPGRASGSVVDTGRWGAGE